ncbi:hypothetical protein [Streptomyces sp. NPDC048340]|uniref:hypothetical protein n=1 Tax=Streptomyces sp. NPDC048340 TaxID=3365537 RepID=UPI00371B7378
MCAAAWSDRDCATRARLGADPDPDPEVRAAVTLAGNPYLDPDRVDLPAADPEDDVRLAASLHPGLTDERRADVEAGGGPASGPGGDAPPRGFGARPGGTVRP